MRFYIRTSCLPRAAFIVAGLVITLPIVAQSTPAPTASPAAAISASIPDISAEVPFFYYNHLDAAKDWYEHKLGLKKVADHGWFAVFKVAPHAYLGLINATEGSLKPVPDKGVLLSISTNNLEAWYKRLKGVKGMEFATDLHIAAKGLVEEFSVRDPEGYLVEFFHWKSDPKSPPNPFIQ